jgi:hypothetical protein
VIRRGHYLIDLHCGDLVEDLMPFSLMQESGHAEVDGRAQALAVAFGLPYVVVQPYGGGPVVCTTNGAARFGRPFDPESARQLFARHAFHRYLLPQVPEPGG